ncbi:hypothetical protein PR048_030857 [Dryococelus australis]|uniref:Uncharacterized protein n=1 Tax=Dryococelus australis TaxID=614101 RepID=A0ABQ9GA36_9NEOP|nr:hypothetical protein PR048_030857 [Dryococelus australis]
MPYVLTSTLPRGSARPVGYSLQQKRHRYATGSSVDDTLAVPDGSFVVTLEGVGTMDEDVFPVRVNIVSTQQQRRNERAGETEYPRETPPTNGIVQHDSHMRKSRVTRPLLSTSGYFDPMNVKRGAYGAAADCNDGGKWEIPEKTHRPAASSVTIPSEIEPGSRWWEASSSTTTPPFTLRDDSLVNYGSLLHALNTMPAAGVVVASHRVPLSCDNQWPPSAFGSLGAIADVTDHEEWLGVGAGRGGAGCFCRRRTPGICRLIENTTQVHIIQSNKGPRRGAHVGWEQVGGHVGEGVEAVHQVIEASMERRQNESAAETEEPRENPPTDGIVRHDSHS